MIYIPPNIKFFLEYSEYLKYQPLPYPYEGFDKFSSMDEIFNSQKLFILAEPGFGKTELLKKIVETTSFESMMLDLKNINYTISLKENIDNQNKFPNSIKTKNFVFNDLAKVIICLDALDEVPSQNLSNVFDMIRTFVTKYTKVKIYISCRRLYFDNYEQIFSQFQFKYLGIYSFTNRQIYEYLLGNGFSQDNITRILKDFFRQSKQAIIQTPRYLSLLSSYLSENGITNFEDMNRLDLFEYFIYKKLEKESAVTMKNNIAIVKRTLEKLALIMEIHQSNKISIDEYMTILGEINDNLSVSLLNNFDIREFFDKSLLKNNIDSIEFENTEFQEYLAAKEINRFGKIEQTTFDLVVMQQIREIHPSWFNVLNYLVEMNVNLLKPILDFGMKDNGIVDSSFFQLITNANAQLLSAENRVQIFENVINYYQENHLSIEYELTRNLSNYYLGQHFNFLKNNFEKFLPEVNQNVVEIRNIFAIVFEILEKHLFETNQRKFWKEMAFEIINDKHADLNLRRELLYISRYLRDKALIKEMLSIWSSVDEQTKDIILNLSIELDPNNPNTINHIIEGLKYESAHSIYGIKKITDLIQLKTLFSTIASNDDVVENFYRRINTNDSNSIIAKLRESIDDEIILVLKDFIIKSFSNSNANYVFHVEFPYLLSELISENDENFIFEFMKRLKDADVNSTFGLSNLFRYMLKESQIKDFIDKAKEIYGDDFVALQTLLRTNGFNMKIYEKGREYFPKEYEQYELKTKENKSKDGNEFKVYNDFKTLLDFSSNKNFYSDVFVRFAGKSNIINKYIDKESSKKLIDLTTYVLKDFDPLSSGFKIETVDTVKFHPWINFYGECIICADLLKIDVCEFRQNIINFVPFAFDDALQSIFNVVKSITSEEFVPLLKVYEEKIGDLWKYMTDNFLKFVQRYNLVEAVPTIKGLIDLKDSILDSRHINYKVRAIQLIESISPDISFLKQIFQKYFKEKDSTLLAITANELLIVNYNDEDSIKWRMKEIKDRSKKANFNNELKDRIFSSPLMKVTNPKLETLYLEFLDSSFKIQKKNKEYGAYMRETVINYFDNLRIYKSFSPLFTLEKFIKKFEEENGFGWLYENLRRLKRNYLVYIGKPETMMESVLKYNMIKARQFEKISTSLELFEVIKRMIKFELNNWIKGEGIKLISNLEDKLKFDETALQKLIRLQFENILLKNGFRKEEINIQRESQLLDDSRTDFLVGYGFVTPILIELKLSSNSDLKGIDLNRKKSFKKLRQYITDCEVDYAILLIYCDENWIEEKWHKFIDKIIKFCKNIEKVEVIGIPTN